MELACQPFPLIVGARRGNPAAFHTFWYVRPMTTLAAAKGSATRSRLLEAAIDRMAVTGPAVNFERIAADVGLTKGALYHHFGSVDGLVEGSTKRRSVGIPSR